MSLASQALSAFNSQYNIEMLEGVGDKVGEKLESDNSVITHAHAST